MWNTGGVKGSKSLGLGTDISATDIVASFDPPVNQGTHFREPIKVRTRILIRRVNDQRQRIMPTGRLTAVVLLFIAALHGQKPASFEVASIKPSNSNSPPMAINRTRGQFATSNTSLPFLIRWAYDLDEDRLIGVPRGLESATFDIVAKTPDGNLAPGQLQLMMQSLLAERFRLRIHKETREISSYVLVTDKDGPKVHFVDLGEGFGQNPFSMTDRGRLVGSKVTAEMLAKVLAGQIGRPVADLTAIKTPFDFTLEWNPDMDLPAGAGAQPESSAGRNRSSIFTAISEQLGFKLNSRRSAVEVVVIDSVETRPTDN
jgi:uncharacterized protein (TIGR03435 family)